MSAIKYYMLYIEDDYAEVVETYDDWYYTYEEAKYLAREHNQKHNEEEING